MSKYSMIIFKKLHIGNLKKSDFKMLEKAPYELPDPFSATSFLFNGIKEEEKTYGPVFTVRFIKYYLAFITEKIQQEPPKDIKTLDELAKYIFSISDQYPTPYAGILYAQPKAERDFQGSSGGAGTMIEARGLAKDMKKAHDKKKKNIDVEEVLINLRNFAVQIKFCPAETGYRNNKDGSVDVFFPNCPYKDGCLKAYNEGVLKRPNGRLRCGPIHIICQVLADITGEIWDYDRLEPLYEQGCVSRLYTL